MSEDNGIGTLRETSLHAELKQWYRQAGDRLEAPVDGYLIDIVRGDRLIEIQTGNFTALRSKLRRLLPNWPVLVVYPIAQAKWICRIKRDGRQVARRKSPKRGRVVDLFGELVRLPALATHANLAFEVLLTQEEEVWRDDGQGSWRRKGWSIADRRLLKVVDRQLFSEPQDFLKLIPAELDGPFTNRDLAQALDTRRRTAERMSYCLRKMGLLQTVGKQGRFNLYAPANH
ncbi:MAG: hypothetical protein R3300_07065 [Candidatus Promineifilaceae bacterium]|nr:hypothetical protein [Candidatus Promineifilaceae bacterium]